MKLEDDLNEKPYSSFAEIYDRIMCSVDYEAWTDYVEQLLEKHAKRPRTLNLVDLACGTGSSTLPFARRGYQAVGVDISEDMLEQARLKAKEHNSRALFYKADLRSLSLPWEFDLAVLFQDGLNYILSENELSRVFYEIFSILRSRGLFIFDLTRPGLRCKDQKGSTSVAEMDNLTMIMESRYNPVEKLWTARLTVFQEFNSGFYKKSQEEHREKDHDPEVVAKLLEQAGFTVRAVHPSFRFEPATNLDQKLTFVAEKTAV